jgi:hypothetical protein
MYPHLRKEFLTFHHRNGRSTCPGLFNCENVEWVDVSCARGRHYTINLSKSRHPQFTSTSNTFGALPKEELTANQVLVNVTVNGACDEPDGW